MNREQVHLKVHYQSTFYFSSILRNSKTVYVATDGENGSSVPEEAMRVRILIKFKPELNRELDHREMGPNGGNKGRKLVPRVKSHKTDK